MLEIGCGVGRMMKMLARVFGQVTAVDVSREMISRARINLEPSDNISLVLGNGATLSAIGDNTHDFAFSFLVFRHISTREVIASYCREVHRVLKPGSLSKFQVQGSSWERSAPPDTWSGVSIAEEDAAALCEETGFTFEHGSGAGLQ